MSSDYSYDEEGTLWPFFVFTLTTLVTLPLTYVVVNRTRDPAAAFPRIKTDYRLKDSDLVDAQRKLERRKQRKIWIAGMAIAGWAIMAYTMYLIYVTPATVQKLWNPYDILGISEVWT
jgi:translocation protein SEC63